MVITSFLIQSIIQPKCIMLMYKYINSEILRCAQEFFYMVLLDKGMKAAHAGERLH
jgi:hypothetical protein